MSSIPSSLCLLTSLPSLALAHNRFTSSLPSCMGNLLALTSFTLDYNSLSSTIPNALGRLTNLAGLSLGHNRFVGSVPANLSRLTRLASLDLSYNHLNGAPPFDLGSDLPQSAPIYVTGNGFQCSVPFQSDGQWTSSYTLHSQISTSSCPYRRHCPRLYLLI